MPHPLLSGIPAPLAQAAAWLLTYALHSTLLLAVAALVTRRLRGRALALQETIWRCALVGGILTASLQLALGQFGHAPVAGRFLLPTAPAATAIAAPAATVPAALAMAGHAEAGAAAAASDTARAALAYESARPAAPEPATRFESDLAIRRASEPAMRHAAVPAARASGAAPSARLSTAALAAWTAGPAVRALRQVLASANPLAVMVALWMAGAALLLAGFARSFVSLRGRLRYRPQVVAGGILERLARLAGEAGLAGAVRLTCTWRLRVPVALPGRPGEVCVPPRALFELNDEQQDAMLAHELGHLARRDPAWLVGIQLLVSVFFFQPLNWMARRRLRELSELLCDEWAVSRTGRPLSLAGCLAEVAGWSLGASSAQRQIARLPVPSLASRSSLLARRIRRLLDRPAPSLPAAVEGAWTRRLAVLAGAVLLGVALAAPGFSVSAAPAPAVASGAAACSHVTAPVAAAAPAATVAAAGPAAAAGASSAVAPAAAASPAEAADAEPAIAEPAGADADDDRSGDAAAVAAGAGAEARAAAGADATARMEREAARMAAAAARFAHAGGGGLSSQDLAQMGAALDKLSQQIDLQMHLNLDRLGREIAASQAATQQVADMPPLRYDLDGTVAQSLPSAADLRRLEADIRKLVADAPKITEEQARRLAEEVRRDLKEHPALSPAEAEHIRRETRRLVDEVMAKLPPPALDAVERQKVIADVKRLTDAMRPNPAQLEALQKLERRNRELTDKLDRQREELRSMEREIEQQAKVLRDLARRESEAHRSHPSSGSSSPSSAAPPQHPAAPPAAGAAPSPTPPRR